MPPFYCRLVGGKAEMLQTVLIRHSCLAGSKFRSTAGFRSVIFSAFRTIQDGRKDRPTRL